MSTCSSTPVPCFCPELSPPLLHEDSPKTLISMQHLQDSPNSISFEQQFNFSFVDWTVPDPYMSPVARVSLVLNSPFKQANYLSAQDLTTNGRQDHKSCSPDTNYFMSLSPASPRIFSSPPLPLPKCFPSNSCSEKENLISPFATLLLPCVAPTLRLCRDIPPLDSSSSSQPILSSSTNNIEERDMEPTSSPTILADPIISGPSMPLSPLTPLSELGHSRTDSKKNKTRHKRKRSRSSSPLHSIQSRRLPRPAQRVDRLKGRPGSPISCPSTRILPCDISHTVVFRNRTFPKTINLNLAYLLFYRQFPLSSYFQFENEQSVLSSCSRVICFSYFCLRSPTILSHTTHPGGIYNPPRDMYDLYTPRFVRGKGYSKVGLCPICVESTDRGGEGKKLWLSMKFSAFKWYVAKIFASTYSYLRTFVPQSVM